MIKLKRKLSKWEKRAIIIQTIFVAGIIGFLFFSTSPRGLYPLHGMAIAEQDFIFEIENGEQVVIARDIEFTNSIILEDGSEITLPPGEYYWKVKSNFRESEPQRFVIEGKVGLDLKIGEEIYVLENLGNVDLDIIKEKERDVEQYDTGCRRIKRCRKR